MRISDWSSDVCSSDLIHDEGHGAMAATARRWWPRESAQCVDHQPRRQQLRQDLRIAAAHIDQIQRHAVAIETRELGGDGRIGLGPVGDQHRHVLVAEGLLDAGRMQCDAPVYLAARSDERRVGKECLRTFNFWWLPY